MPYWNFEYTKAVIYTVVKVGGGTGHDPATEVTHYRLNQPPVFSSVHVAELKLLSFIHVKFLCCSGNDSWIKIFGPSSL